MGGADNFGRPRTHVFPVNWVKGAGLALSSGKLSQELPLRQGDLVVGEYECTLGSRSGRYTGEHL